MIRVQMLPHPKWFRHEESGIKRVCLAYARYLPDYDIRIVEDNESCDLVAVHAGEAKECSVSHLHGLMWTADYSAEAWEWAINEQVINLARMAKAITVPSEWVAQTIRRDMKRNPYVIGHGIEWDEWQHDGTFGDYVLWNKNRFSDVCDPAPMQRLAEVVPKQHFVSTFAVAPYPDNITEPTGVIPHDQMKQLVQAALVYLSTTKETFGIGILESMASGVPVLGFAQGGILDLVEHGINGYLAQPGNIEDLAIGLDYCIRNRRILGANGREMAKQFTWPKAVEKVAGVYRTVLAGMTQPHDVSVVVVSYNYSNVVSNPIESALAQTLPPKQIIVVDDGSPDDGATLAIVSSYSERDPRVQYVRQQNSGVAVARNHGISLCDTRYVACLDADDAMAPEFLERCVTALQEDPSLGVAYTGLRYILPDGKTGISKWPGQWDFDAQLKKQNQVPTLTVMRRDMVQQLGGYKSRYCPDGAGSEDAEFWTRCGAYGWKAKKVTEEALFLYSWQSGRVSGNKNYQEVDWLAWHPWARDGQHPFASYAKPKRWSHPVRAYDEPIISVIVPVGPGHERNVFNALDSLEAQTFRKWEAIVVNDTGGTLDLTPYPYVHIITTEGKRGAGYARNRGAERARAPLLLWLDADDWLYPECLDRMMRYWELEECLIYTDYVGKAQVEDVTKLAPNLQRNVLYRDPKSHDTVIRYELPEYNWEKAQRQPEVEPWIWCNVTTLTPRLWHREIGGFDESMPAWEDVDYWYRMAFAGKPFVRIPEPLLVYLFYSGNRRDTGYRNHQDLIAYLRDKYREVEKVMCTGCGQRRNLPPPPIAQKMNPGPGRQVSKASPAAMISDGDFVLCDYITPNRSNCDVIGHSVFKNRIDNVPMVRANPTGWRIRYGYRAGGDRFLVHREDLRLMPHLFAAVSVIRQEETRQAPPSPVPIVANPPVSATLDEAKADTPLAAFDLQKLPGIGATIAAQMEADGVTTLQGVANLGAEGLRKYQGVGEARANAILEAARKQLGGSL